MSTVRFSGPTNSTFFTTCCRVAITDRQQKCLQCGEDVYPFYKGMSDRERDEAEGHIRRSRWAVAMSSGYA